MNINIVKTPSNETRNDHYLCNREPLHTNPFVKLPLGAVRPRGWLKHQLGLMVEGMVGRLPKLSKFLASDNGWFQDGNEGWEEQPYWLRGAYPVAVLTGDERLLKTVNQWIEATLASETAEGYFGSSYHRARKGKSGRIMCDLWPHMVMLDALIQHHEFTKDKRVPELMQRFFKFCAELPDAEFMPRIGGTQWQSYREDFGDWKIGIQMKRAGDMLPHIYWLYNRTGAKELLALATRFHESILPPVSEWLDDHVVHFTQRFAYSGLYGQQSDLSAHLAQTEYWYTQHIGTWGQQPRGIFGADERIRPGKTDPRQGCETCAMIEFAKNFYLLGRISGDPKYADRCEDIMLNHFPASQTADLKALHYLTASNQPQLDASEQHDYYNKGRQVCYSPHIYRCCQHNVAMGWPWYAENLWQASSDNGLAAWLYAGSDVKTVVGDGTEVTLREETDYPFDTNVRITGQTDANCVFPLYLRVPRWCSAFRANVSGKTLDVNPEPGSFVRIEREWSQGDIISIEMPVGVSLTTWPRTGSVTVDRGPLSYSLRIEEQWKRCGGTDEWPEWEVFPKTPWHYGLIVGENKPVIESIQAKPVSPQPWTLESAPIELKAKAKRIPDWEIGDDETVMELPQSPVCSQEQEEDISLIPMGCARLRIACLPVVRK